MIKISKLFAAMVLAGVASHSFAADTIKIGIAGPKTGPVTQYGDMQFIGAKQAIKDINAKGGVDGKMLEAKEYDDACDPKQAVAVANKVVNDGVKFVVGHLCSSSTQPASDIYEDEGVIMITPAATSPEITARGYKLIFRTIGLDSAQGPAAGNYIADHVKPKVVAVLHDKQQYGEGIATAVKQTLEKKGTKVAVFEGLNAGDKDFSSIIQKLKQNNVDFVYYGGYHPELGLILRQAQEKGLKAKFMGPEGVGNDSISQIAQNASEGLLVTLPKSFDPTRRTRPSSTPSRLTARPERPVRVPGLLGCRADRRRHQGRQVRRHRQGGCRHPRRHLQDPDRRPVLRREGRPERLQVRGLRMALRQAEDRSLPQ
jgi:branched-chain amino acid transport system substrate-binding protein